ncbi:MAG: AAA family ATPase [Ruminococcus sp.]
MRIYKIVIGSSSYFDKALDEAYSIIDEKNGKIPSFLELIRIFDAQKQSDNTDTVKTPLLFIRNNDYNGIVNAAHDRLGPLIEDITHDKALILIHNPPRVLYEYLQDKKARNLITLEEDREEYSIQKEPEKFKENILRISDAIVGQDRAIIEISKSLWYLISVQRKKPYVIMLYGNSSLGKTELVREIAKHFFEGKVLEKHLSMFKNNNYSDYFFGEEPNRRSLGFDLLERTSNLIFLDELDKCPEFFYSAFYTLFDNVEVKDATYDVDISGTIIILTSNYLSEDEMKQHLGMPIFYRIDKMIKFEDFSPQTIYEITMKEIEARKEEYGDMISPERIYEIVSKEISTKNENARTIKFKVQQVIENLLFKEVENSLADKEKSLCPEEKT